MIAAGVAGAEDIFDQNLRFGKILFIPPGPAGKGIDLNPFAPGFPTSLSRIFRHHKFLKLMVSGFRSDT
jgi:hypothetical protein